MKLLKLSAVMSLLAITLSGCATPISTSPKGLEAPIEKAAFTLANDMKNGGYNVVTTEELKKWVDEKKNITIVSTLPLAEDRKYGKIPKAVNSVMPDSEMELTPEDKEILTRVAGHDKEITIVVYCSYVACRRSHVGAKLLVDNGYKKVYRYPAGIAAWEQAGFSTEKSY